MNIRQNVIIFDIMSGKKYKTQTNTSQQVNEPVVAYAPQAVAATYNLFGSRAASDFDIINIARQGFPKSALLIFAKRISVGIQELANILHISERTLQRYDDTEIIKKEYAEKAVELARLYQRGEEVFGSIDKFKGWMKHPAYVFNGVTPISLLDTSAGFDLVFKELGRIEHGIFA